MTGSGSCLRSVGRLWILTVTAAGGWALDLDCATVCPDLDLACGRRAGVWGRNEEARRRARIYSLLAGAWWRDEKVGGTTGGGEEVYGTTGGGGRYGGEEGGLIGEGEEVGAT
jgi:hypothetical protein